mmetsp:Transcript_63919/g.207769  ORF Transcript_63919/g.207769 Transcript_63919/m.207769 type:complete len:132 (+) Transcript_63919:2681-3076(+)
MQHLRCSRQASPRCCSPLELGALERQLDGRHVPSQFGRLLQKLPLEPELGLLIWNGLRLGELESCEILAGIVQRGLPFLSDSAFSPADVRELVNLRHACCPDSDLLAGLRAFRAWRAFLKRQSGVGRITSL